MGMDMISNLPHDIISSILVLLPLEEAARTSILSTQWRSKWLSMPDLEFIFPSIPKVSSWPDFVKFVDHVLSQYLGPIQNFKLVASPRDHVFLARRGVYFLISKRTIAQFSDIHRWIHILTNSGIVKLQLDCHLVYMCSRECYKVPSSLFCWQELCYLDLKYCTLSIPSVFTGLQNLSTLRLSVDLVEVPLEFAGFPNLTVLQVFLEKPHGDGDITRLISNCVRLEKLSLLGHYNSVKIHGPNLRHVEIGGGFEDLSFGTCPLLARLRLDVSAYARNQKWIEVIRPLYGIMKLELCYVHHEYFFTENVPKRISTRFHHLRSLCLFWQYRCPEEIMTVFCLCQISPNLSDLSIIFNCLEDVNGWKWKDPDLDSSFEHLQFVKVSIASNVFELEFVKYLLANAPKLDTIEIRRVKLVETDESKTLESLMQFERASAKAQISYIGLVES